MKKPLTIILMINNEKLDVEVDIEVFNMVVLLGFVTKEEQYFAILTLFGSTFQSIRAARQSVLD